MPLSDDRSRLWDGSAWRPTSPDRSHYWDGEAWRAVPFPTVARPPATLPWHRRTGWVIALAVVLPPFGLFWLWRHRPVRRGAAAAITAAVALLWLAVAVAVAPAPNGTNPAPIASTSAPVGTSTPDVAASSQGASSSSPTAQPAVPTGPPTAPPAGATPFPAPAAPAGVAFPNSQLTPGDTTPGVTVAQVCTAGYAASMRHVTSAQYHEVYGAYGIAYPEPTGTYELDHLVPLELGGVSTNSNLWPEPASPTPGFHQKDQLENAMHRLVCAGQLDLHRAQREIATNWYTAYIKYLAG